MKLSFKLLVCSVLFSLSAFAQDDYKLVWSDEFDGTSVNRDVWNVIDRGDGFGNAELQYYRPANVSIGKHPETGESCLILTAKKENSGGRNCTSGKVESSNKMHFRYGMIEIRANIPFTNKGLWPAIWMMGNSGGWPSNGEIDIVEMGHNNGIVAGTSDRYFGGHWHWGSGFPNGYQNTGSSITPDYAVQGKFVTFRLYWDDINMQLYLDQDTRRPNEKPYASLGTNTYFQQSSYLILNLAVGGDKNFPFPAGGANNINNVTAFANTPGGEPKMYIDYVRVYQRGDTGEEFRGQAKNGNGSSPVNGGRYVQPIYDLKGISLKTTTQLLVGETEQLTPIYNPENATDRRVTWTTSDGSVASVVSNGTVRGRKLGTATITATSVDGGFKASCLVHVVAAKDIPSVTSKEISVFPNPVEDVLYIQSETAVSGVILSDLNGRKLFESQQASEVNMSNYSAGMYLLIIKTANGETVVRKINKK